MFSTKGRQRLIVPALREQLWPYLGGIARQNDIKALAVGGIEDHVHIVLSLPSRMEIAKALQLIKSGSSKWIHDTFSNQRGFAWQEGYGAFSIGISQLDATIAYVNSQPEHHHNKTFEEEFLAILERHGIPYDFCVMFGAEGCPSVVPPGLTARQRFPLSQR